MVTVQGRRESLVSLAGLLCLAANAGPASADAGLVASTGPLQLEVRRLEPRGPFRARVPLLLIPGAYQGAWAFEDNMAPFFAARGYDTYSMSLRGHGASAGQDRVSLARFDDYVDDVATVASTLPDAPVLIGHSLGGLLAQRVAQTVRASAVVPLATPTPRSMHEGALRLLSRFPWPMIRFALSGNADHIYRDAAVVRGLLFGGAHDAVVERSIPRRCPMAHTGGFAGRARKAVPCN